MKLYMWMLILISYLALGSLIAKAVDVAETDNQQKFLKNNLTKSRDNGLISGSVSIYQIDEVNAATNFIRYASGSGLVFIKRITVAGTVTTIEKSTTNWTARVAATYVPIND